MLALVNIVFSPSCGNHQIKDQNHEIKSSQQVNVIKCDNDYRHSSRKKLG